MPTVEERLAVAETKLEGVETRIKGMETKIDEMHAILLQAKGARWAILTMASLGGFVAGITAKLLPLFK